jgi:ATP-binding cassette subfamily B protein
MQDGFIFTDSILNNISLGNSTFNEEKLNKAIEQVNLNELVNSLPLRLNTKIGTDGHGLSQGQKQRILIARAIYKNPEFILFDEATNSLDSEIERMIINNLDNYFAGKTMIMCAHRLSTVRNADLIIVLDKGIAAESGNHEDLIKLKGKYYELIKGQL